jgi:hypothetical protein
MVAVLIIKKKITAQIYKKKTYTLERMSVLPCTMDKNRNEDGCIESH